MLWDCGYNFVASKGLDESAPFLRVLLLDFYIQDATDMELHFRIIQKSEKDVVLQILIFLAKEIYYYYNKYIPKIKELAFFYFYFFF